MVLTRVGYLGPEGSFSHEAVSALENVDPVACESIPQVLAMVASGVLEQGLVPLENAIEGTVSATIDGLVFDHELVIEREVVLPIHLQLLARPGVRLDQITKVSSYVHALEQCRGFLSKLDGVVVEQATSTSQAARDVASLARAAFRKPCGVDQISSERSSTAASCGVATGADPGAAPC